MVSAACPQCKILLVEANSPTIGNLGTAVNTAVSHGRDRGLEQLRRVGELERPDLCHDYYKHPGVAITVLVGRQRLRRRVPREFALT